MRRASLCLLLLLLACFAAAVWHLFRVRHQSGDIYPPYSSLRADPLGTKALYDSVALHLRVQRNYRPLNRLARDERTTLWMVGADPGALAFHTSEYRQLEALVREGGRWVCAFAPVRRRPMPSPLAPPRPGARSKTRRALPPSEAELSEPHRQPADSLWGLEFAYSSPSGASNGTLEPRRARRQTDAPLPAELAVHTALWFDRLDPAWSVTYADTSNRAVLIERSLGQGTVVFCANSYPLSNQALLEDRQPELLTWLLGSNRAVIFDETHLGLAESPGIAALVRKYQLHGFFTALLVLAALFIWRQAVSFMPPLDDAAQSTDDAAEGRAASLGFVHLLRRNVAPSEVLALCLTEWKKSCAPGVSPGRLAQVQAVIDAENTLSQREHQPVRAYQAICRILAHRSISTPVAKSSGAASPRTS